MTHYYKREDYKLPKVTSIISDCSNKSGPLTQWAANMTVEWIKANCNASHVEFDETLWTVTQEDLDSARFNFRKVSQDALDVGSATHKAIEYFLKTGKEPEWLK